MTDTTAVRIPSGAKAKMILSRRLMDSERNCLVSLSPKRVIKGAWHILDWVTNGQESY